LEKVEKRRFSVFQKYFRKSILDIYKCPFSILLTKSLKNDLCD
jgi:hypothetical protein